MNVICSLYKIGDRIGQIVFVPVPAVELVESDELSETERGAGGYGSTGK
jgi:dUTP pyrophosphatase